MLISELRAELNGFMQQFGDMPIKVGITGVYKSKNCAIEIWNNIIDSEHLYECHIVGSDQE